MGFLIHEAQHIYAKAMTHGSLASLRGKRISMLDGRD